MLNSPDVTPAQFALPPTPPDLKGAVKAWSEPVTLSTELAGRPNRNPEFLGGGLRPYGYPLPAASKIAAVVASHPWESLHLENEFLRLLILPGVAGRIHLALEKSSGQDILYRPETLRVTDASTPVPGGLEIHWPSYPRPRTLTSTQHFVEEHGDGSRTVWCSSFDPQTRIKGMHGFCLYPGRAYIETKVRLFNRTSFVHEVNWSATAGVPAFGNLVPLPSETPADQPPFSGFYSNAAQRGLLHIANGALSGAQTLTLHSTHGEVRAAVYSNEPSSATALMPGETKAFSQFWYPYTNIGPVDAANIDAAVRLSFGDSAAVVGAAVTRSFGKAAVVLEAAGNVVARWNRDLTPSDPVREEVTLPPGLTPDSLTLKILTSAGRELISYTPKGDTATVASPTTSASPDLSPPKKLASPEALYRSGLRARYRHGSPYKPEDYWIEALKRDPNHAASHNALGLLLLGRGEFGEAEARFRSAVTSLGGDLFDAQEAEFHYNLGLVLRLEENDSGAYAAFQRASWSYAWRSSSLFAMAEIDCKRGNYGVVPKSLYESLRLNADNNNARNLAVVLFRRFGRTAEAEQLVRESLALDPLDPWAAQLAGRPFPGDNASRLDLAFDYARAGLYDLAAEVLTAADTFATDGSLPMVHYALASFYMRLGDLQSAQREYTAAAASSPDFCFPHRLDEMMVLARAIALQPEDARAQYYLGNLLYHYGLPMQAVEIWNSSARLDPRFPTVWRNLAVAYALALGDKEKSLDAFDHAVAADPNDSEIFSERDELWRRLGVPPTLRFTELQEHKTLADRHEVVALELASLYNTHGEPENALSLFSSEKLKGWEQSAPALDEYVRTFVKLGRKALAASDTTRARDLFQLPLSLPAIKSDDEGGIPRAAELQFWLGEAFAIADQEAAAQACWQRNIDLERGPRSSSSPNENNFFVALSSARLGDRQHSRKMLRELWFAGRRIARDRSSVGAGTAEERGTRHKKVRVRGLLLQSQARVGLGQYKLAARLLEQLLSIDPNCPRALDLMSDLEQAKQGNR